VLLTEPIVGGLLHVGAHHAQELAHYDSLNPKEVVWVEADPRQWPRLRPMMGGRHRLIEAAAGDRVGSCAFHLTSISMCNSLLPVERLMDDSGKRIVETGEVEVPMVTIDSLNLVGFTHLVLDVQGAEKLAFDGAREFLKGVTHVVTEIMAPDSYAGCTTEAEFVEALKEFDLAASEPNGEGRDTLWTRRNS
jgi:FkbM family methyltransferase